MRQRKFKWSSISSSGWVHEVMEYSSAIPPQRAAPLNGHSSSSVPTAGNVWRIKIVPWFWSEHLHMIGKFGLRRDIFHTYMVIWNLVKYISLAIYLVCQRCKPKQTKPIKKTCHSERALLLSAGKKSNQISRQETFSVKT